MEYPNSPGTEDQCYRLSNTRVHVQVPPEAVHEKGTVLGSSYLVFRTDRVQVCGELL